MTTKTKGNPLANRTRAFRYARGYAALVGLNPNDADAVAHRVMILWDPSYTRREWDELIDQEVAHVAQP